MENQNQNEDELRGLSIENLLQTLSANNIKMKEWVIEQINNADICSTMGIKIDFPDYHVTANDYYCSKKKPPSLQISTVVDFGYAAFDATTNNDYCYEEIGSKFLNVLTKTPVSFIDKIIHLEEEE